MLDRSEADILEQRNNILNIENEITDSKGSWLGDSLNCPLEHFFVEGIYIRKMFVPKGVKITGKINKIEQVFFLLSGEMDVLTENGHIRLIAPCFTNVKAGTKKVGIAITDCVWVNVYPNPSNTQDFEILEENNVCSSFEDYQKYLYSKENKCITT